MLEGLRRRQEDLGVISANLLQKITDLKRAATGLPKRVGFMANATRLWNTDSGASNGPRVTTCHLQFLLPADGRGEIEMALDSTSRSWQHAVVFALVKPEYLWPGGKLRFNFLLNGRVQSYYASSQIDECVEVILHGERGAEDRFVVRCGGSGEGGYNEITLD